MIRLVGVLTSAVALAAWAQDDDAPFDIPHRTEAPPLATARALPPVADVLTFARTGSDGRWWLPRDGGVEPSTIDVPLQEQLTEILRTYQTPYAAVVAMEPSSGRVLAMAEHSEARPELRGLCTKAVYPAASIFKIVTATALLQAGVPADEQICFHGGKRRVGPSLLEDSDADGRCLSLSNAMGHSANVAFAKLTSRYLDPLQLKSAAKALRFNVPMPFDVPAEPSLAAIPDDTYSLALAGAGFGDVYLSPLHGAALASVAANGGVWHQPVLFAGDDSPSERVLSTGIANQLTDMLETTITSGTARRIFSERGLRVPGAVGKTGSLADKRPFRDYTWFVGFAPKSSPKVAVGAVIVNDPRWRIRAPWLGREAMRLFLSRHER